MCIYPCVCMYTYVCIIFHLYLLYIVFIYNFFNVYKEVFTISMCNVLYFLFFYFTMTYWFYVLWFCRSVEKYWNRGVIRPFPLHIFRKITVCAGLSMCRTVDNLNYSWLFFSKDLEWLHGNENFFEMGPKPSVNLVCKGLGAGRQLVGARGGGWRDRARRNRAHRHRPQWVTVGGQCGDGGPGGDGTCSNDPI